MTAKEKYDKIIFDAAIDEGLTPLLASFMVAQAEHESAMYTSSVFKNCNNSFGYKYVGQELAEPCSGSPEGDNYAKYKSVEDSSREVARWIKRRMAQFENVKTTDEYVQVLKNNGYFGGDLEDYENAVGKFWGPIKSMMNTAITKYPTETILAGVTFASLLTFYIFRFAKKK